MTRLISFFAALTMLFSFSAQAQDLKPVKDKGSKKYGYQAKNKTWVIAPTFDSAKKFDDGYAEVELNGYRGIIDVNGAFVIAPEYDDITKFDKNGYCELKRKVNGVKLQGVADVTGRIIIPVEARSVSVDRSGNYIYAKYDVEVPGFKPDQEWGVYDNNGNEIFAPQFSYSPSLREGIGIAKSARNGLYGIIGGDGSVLIPFKYLQLSRSSYSYKGLGTDLSHVTWSEDLLNRQVMPQPGAVIPYDPQDDPIRALAWRRGPIGIRLHGNQVKRVELHSRLVGMQAVCHSLSLDWGFGRFVRLEPCVVPAPTSEAMYFGSGKRFYTLKAFLYERDGSLVKEVCSRGWIEANFRDGAIYNADGKERWLILADPNAVEAPAYTMDVFDYQPISHDDVFSGMGIPVSEYSRLSSLYNFTDLCKDIYEAENVGVCTYLPIVPDMVHARAAHQAAHALIFHQMYRMGDVVNCKIDRRGGEMLLDLSKDLVLHYKDRLDDPSYTMSGGSELIFWGPHNARTIRLSLEAIPKSGNGTIDDVRHTGYSYVYVLSMYEEDGTWLRTLAEAPFVDFVQDGVVVFDKLGIALITRPLHMGPIKIVGEPLPHKLSALESALAVPPTHGPGAKPGSQPGHDAKPGTPPSKNPGTTNHRGPAAHSNAKP